VQNVLGKETGGKKKRGVHEIIKSQDVFDDDVLLL